MMEGDWFERGKGSHVIGMRHLTHLKGEEGEGRVNARWKGRVEGMVMGDERA